MDATEVEYENLSNWDFNSIMDYMKTHIIQIFMLLLVPVIIYIVDYISNINAMMFGLPSAIPGLPSSIVKIPKIKKNSKK
jgi:hypothetical protein